MGLAVLGSPWQCLAALGSAWQSLAVLGSPWQCLAALSSAWEHPKQQKCKSNYLLLPDFFSASSFDEMDSIWCDDGQAVLVAADRVGLRHLEAVVHVDHGLKFS